MQYLILGLIVSIMGSFAYKAIDASMIASTSVVIELAVTVVVMIPVIILTLFCLPKECNQ